MARSSVPPARRFTAPAALSGARPLTLIRDPPALMWASIRASVPARSASAVMVAGGMARPGPLRSRRPVAAMLTLPVGRAGVPVIRASALTVPSAPTRSAGRLRSDAVRSSVAPARPVTSNTAWRKPRRNRSIATPSEKPMFAGANSRIVCCRQSASSEARRMVWAAASTLAAAVSRAGAPSRSRSAAASFTSSASTVPLAFACSVPPNRPI